MCQAREAEAQKARTPHEDRRSIKRRTFIAAGVTGFLLAASAPFLRQRWKTSRLKPPSLDTVYLKNPAYLKSHRASDTLLETHTRDGAGRVYIVDERSELAWDSMLNVREFHEGTRRTAREALKRIRAQYPQDDPAQQEKDFLSFVAVAHQVGLFLTEDQFVWSVYNETSRS